MSLFMDEDIPLRYLISHKRLILRRLCLFQNLIYNGNNVVIVSRA